MIFLTLYIMRTILSIQPTTTENNMIISAKTSYEDFKAQLAIIKQLPSMDGNKFIYTDATSITGKSCTVVVSYSCFSGWEYKATLNNNGEQQ